MVIDEANDNVGIGTSSPAEELEVVGNIRATPIVGHWASAVFTAPSGFVLALNEEINTDTTYFEIVTIPFELIEHIQVKKSGYYLITAHAIFTSGALGESARLVVWRYNSENIEQESICAIFSTMAGSSFDGECSSIHFFDANDRVKLQNTIPTAGIVGDGVYFYILRLN